MRNNNALRYEIISWLRARLAAQTESGDKAIALFSRLSLKLKNQQCVKRSVELRISPTNAESCSDIKRCYDCVGNDVCFSCACVIYHKMSKEFFDSRVVSVCFTIGAKARQFGEY